MAPSAAVMSSALVTSKAQTYWPKMSLASPGEPDRPADREVAHRSDQQDQQAEPEQQADPALALDGLDQGVRGVHADQHQDEQEQHHHGAGVDEHLDDAEELGTLDDVEDAEDDHHQRDRDRRVHGLLGEHQAQGGDDRHRAEDPEERRLGAARLGAAGAVRREGGERVHSDTSTSAGRCSSTQRCCSGVAVSTLPW
jgi:hypothetical protein